MMISKKTILNQKTFGASLGLKSLAQKLSIRKVLRLGLSVFITSSLLIPRADAAIPSRAIHALSYQDLVDEDRQEFPSSTEEIMAEITLLQAEKKTTGPVLDLTKQYAFESESFRGVEDEMIAANTGSAGANVRLNAKATGPRRATQVPMGTQPRSAPQVRGTSMPGTDQNLTRAAQLVRSGQNIEASQLLFQMARSPAYQNESAQIKYILGLSLYEMKLYQTAAFVFYDVIRQESRNPLSRYLKQSLEKIALAADYLESDILLKYAIRQINENDFPASNKDMLLFRLAELKLSEKDYVEAAKLFSRVRPGNAFFAKAKYNQGLALAESKNNDLAVRAFEDLIALGNRASGGVVNRNRVNGLMGKARVLYQAQKWDQSLDIYRDIPRDTEQWHDSLFESSWAMLRSGKFRTALSNFHSLHSPYYEDFYQPESLLLRAIVYLYICRYDEMSKTLDLFKRIYGPVQKHVREILQSDRGPGLYLSELQRISNNFDAYKASSANRTGTQIPFLVGRQILKEGDIRKTMAYLRKLDEEKRRVSSLSGAWQNSGVGQYAKRVVERRIDASKQLAGKQVRRHLIIMANDLRDLFEQSELLRVEVISGRKEVVKKEIAGKGLKKQAVDEDSSRDYYIQNGYEYWPFKGEYWLDEIGNYHYVGVQACEQ